MAGRHSIDLTGKFFGRWTVLHKTILKNDAMQWLCLCECGALKEVAGSKLRRGTSKSCGCHRRYGYKKEWTPEIVDDKTFRVPLTFGEFALIDKEDYDKIKNIGWSCGPNKKYALGYNSKGNHSPVKMHRLILDFPDSDVDHINGNTFDNRKENLRLCNASENLRNRPMNKNNSTGFKGVSFSKNKKRFYARIQHLGKYYHLGNANTAEEASLLYIEAAKKFQGTFIHQGLLK